MARSTASDRMKMYRLGLKDSEIASAECVSRTAIVHWRRRFKLPPHVANGKYVRDHTLINMLLYQLGWSDKRIAAHRSVTADTITRWRKIRHLPSNFKQGANERWRPAPGPEVIVERVRRAIGNSLARDIVDDAVASMFEAILDGSLALDDIEKAARKYGNRTLDKFASRFGPRSLDEELGEEGDGFRMIDMIKDESSSSWLEEMGATVW